MSAAFPARFPGRCGACGNRMHEGDPIRFDATSETNFVHDACPDEVGEFDLKPTETVCQACWLVHPEGACDR